MNFGKDLSTTNLNLKLENIRKAIWTSDVQFDFDSPTKTNIEVIGVGDSAYLALKEKIDSSDDIPFTTPANYTYDPTKIEVTGGVAKLKASVIGENDWPFTTPANYTYDPLKIEVVGGVAKLVGTPLDTYAWWHLNEVSGTNVPDSSGNGRDGTTQNMEDGDWVAGKLNNCLLFGGIDEYVNCGAITQWEYTQAFSVELWIKYTTGAVQGIIGNLLLAGTGRGWQIYTTGVTLGFQLRGGAANKAVHVTTAANMNNDAWHHVIITYNGTGLASGVTCYVDNVIKSLTILADSLSEESIISNQPLSIGQVNSAYMVGNLDEVVLYDTVLSDIHVSNRWNSGTGTEIMSESYPIDNPNIYPSTGYAFTTALHIFTETATKPAGSEVKYQVSVDDGVTWYYYGSVIPELYAHWKLNEVSGVIAYDSSPNGRDGELNKMEAGDWVAGKLNNCLLFDGVDEHVNCNDIASFERTDSFTIEVWFKTNSTKEQAIISRMDKASPYQGWQIKLNNGQVYFELINSTVANNFIRVHVEDLNYADNVWHYLAVTYNGSSLASGIHIYIDSDDKTLIVNQNSLTATIQNAKFMDIAAREGSNLFFNGYIDEIVICTKVLSLQQILFRWQDGVGTELLCTWEITDGTYAQANTAIIVNLYLQYLINSGTFKFRALLHSDAGDITPELDNIYIGEEVSFPVGNFEIAMNWDIDPICICALLLITETVTKPANTDIYYQYSVDSGSNYNESWLTANELQTEIQSIGSPDKLRIKFQLSTINNEKTPEIDNLNITSEAGYENTGSYESTAYIPDAGFSHYLKQVVSDIEVPIDTTCILEIRSINNTLEEGYLQYNFPIDDIELSGKIIQWRVTMTSVGANTPKVNYVEILFKVLADLLSILE